MARKSFDRSHFLHIDHRKYRKQYKQLRKLFRRDSYLVKPGEALKEKQLYKYWKVRHTLFSKISDSPIYLTNELWFSVTNETIASFLARFIKACLPNATKILDVFCGGGGNTIQFAKVFPCVYGVDASLEHLYCTYRNSTTYGVSDRIWLKYGSWQRIAAKGRFSKLGIDCIFGSPPWGGPQYLKGKVYDLESSLQPIGITELLETFHKISPNVVLFLPRNSDLNQLSRATRTVLGPTAQCRVIYVKDNGYLKGILCMWGTSLVSPPVEQADSQDEDEAESPQKIASVSYELDG